MANLKLSLAKDLARHLRAGHPWVFKQALVQVPKLPAGAIVDIVDKGRFVARGYFDPHSAICVRVLTRDEAETVDGAFFRRRIARALALRETLLERRETDAYRLVHGEADGLPGVIVDLYSSWAVIKLYSAGLTPHREAILSALRAVVPSLKGIVGRDELDREDLEGDAAPGRMLWGEKAPETVAIRENGVRFLVDLYAGQKTGFFLDQRDNRRLVRDLAQGREVLNCYAYTGGFSVNAALGGAKQVTSVDLDEDTIALCRQNFKENGLSAEAHDFLASDVLETLKTFAAQGRTFDLVILDPPAFAKSQKAVDAAVSGYASLNRVALSVLKEGGLLCTASCTARVSAEQFFDAVKEAAFKAEVDLQLVHQRFQPPDHPVLLQFGQGKYLKFFVLRRTSEPRA
ncbi:MAG: class I SAM-dependent rRNA methyltransferase [Deltaproteobacteria bacterium]|nr:class I SAM-dependent rRNA methyltransferase [Deltaproteobacteria bacterium]